MGKYGLTPAQEAQKRERREEFQSLVKALSEMTDEQRAAMASKMMVVSVEGHVYSLHNQCLLMMQADNVTVCGGFRQWQAHGRKVRKGEHGLMIWVAANKGKDEAPPADGVVSEDKAKFFMGYVWDISQTEAITEGEDFVAPVASVTAASPKPHQPTTADKVADLFEGE